MRVLFITDNYPPEVNAPAIRVETLARHWSAHGHSVHVLTGFPNFPFGKVYPGYKSSLYDLRSSNGIHLHRVWTYMTSNQGLLRRTIDFCSFGLIAFLFSWRIPRVDIVIATSPQIFSAIAGFLISRVRRVPFIFEVRDLWPEQIEAISIIRYKTVLDTVKLIVEYLYRHSDIIVTVGPGYKKQICEMYKIPSERVKIIPNGYEFNLSGETLAPPLKIDVSKTNIFYIGTHGLSQGLDLILSAAHLLKEDNFVFNFVGDGLRDAADPYK